MSRFDTSNSYLQGFGSGQSLVNHGVANADAMMGNVAQQTRLGLAQQESDLRLHEFDWRKSQAAQHQEQQRQRAAIVGNLGLTLLKQKPSASAVDPFTGATVGNPDNEVDSTIAHWIQTGIDTGNADAIEKMIPKLQSAQQRQELVNKIKYVKESGFANSLANPDEKAIMDLAETAASPQMLERGLSMQAARVHREQQDAMKMQGLAAKQAVIDQQNADLESQKADVSGKLASRTAPDGTPYGDANQYDLLMSLPAKGSNSPFTIAHQVASRALGLGKQPTEPQTMARNLRIPMGGDISSEKIVSVTGSKGGTLNWDENDPIVQEFLDLAKQAQPGQDQGAYDAPGLAITGNKESDQQYASRVRAKARALAQQAGWKIGGGNSGTTPRQGGGDMIDQLINEAMQGR